MANHSGVATYRLENFYATNKLTANGKKYQKQTKTHDKNKAEKVKGMRARTKCKMQHATFLTMAAKALQKRVAVADARVCCWLLNGNASRCTKWCNIDGWWVVGGASAEAAIYWLFVASLPARLLLRCCKCNCNGLRRLLLLLVAHKKL